MASPDRDYPVDGPAGRPAEYPPGAELPLPHSPALEFLKDESGRLVYCNKAFESVFCAAGASLIGKADADWLPAEIALRVQAHDRSVLASGGVVEVEET